MLSDEQLDQLAPYCKRIQLVATAMMILSFCFLGALFAMANWAKVHTEIPMLVLIAAGSAMGLYAISYMFFSFFISSTRVEPRGDGGISSAAGVVQTSTIFRYAMIEAACFLNGLVFFLEGGLVNLAVAGLGILLMIWAYPTRKKIVNAVDSLITK